MKFTDEFREPELILRTADEIRRLADPARHYRLMEVCGGHTHAIYRFGLSDLLPPNIELIHGPGCPVCVLPMGRIDDGLSIAAENDVIFAAFGDMMRVPGAHGSPSNIRPAAATSASSTRPPTPSNWRAPIPIATSCSSPSALKPPRPPPRSL